ncbi:MAG TPA: MliC family protein [Methylomirabilota bacterium]|jgi:putative lipoprotein
MLAAIVIAAGMTWGCSSRQTPAVESPGGPSSVADGMEPSAGSSSLAAYAFECDDEQRFVLSRAAGKPDGMDLVLGDRRQRLTHVRTGSGAQYTADGVSVWTKGGEAMLEVAGRVTTCRENRRRSILEDARARGVQFRASGNEPGWVWELMADRMIFVGAYGADRVTTSKVDAPRASTRDGAEYLGVAGSRRMTVRVLPGPCVDTMSGDLAASTVQIELDGKTYRGCGEALR